MNTVLGVFIRLCMAVVLFGVAYFIGRAILARLPNGRLKSLLSRDVSFYPTAPVTRRAQLIAIVVVTWVASWITCVQVLKAFGRLD